MQRAAPRHTDDVVGLDAAAQDFGTDLAEPRTSEVRRPVEQLEHGPHYSCSLERSVLNECDEITWGVRWSTGAAPW